MKNKFLAILLSALLLVTMVPFAFASSADSAAEGIVQGANDAVVFLQTLSPADMNTVFNAFANNKIKTSDASEYGSYDRIIVCLTESYTVPDTAASATLFDSFESNGTKYYSNRSGSFWGNELAATEFREVIVLTSFVTVVDSDKVFSVSGTTITKDNTKTAQTYDYYTAENVFVNLPGKSVYVAFCSDITLDYVRFYMTNANNVTPLFYLQYNNATFGQHCQITRNETDSTLTAWPILMQGQQYGVTYKSYADHKNDSTAPLEYKFTEWTPNIPTYEPLGDGDTQVIKVLGGTWAYISLRNRGTYARNLTYIRGQIDLTLENVTTLASGKSSALMSHDVYGVDSCINATIKNCTFSKFAFFETCLMDHTNKQLSGKLSVTFEGTNTFNNGINGVAQNGSYIADLTKAKLHVENNGTINLGSGKSINGARDYTTPINQSMFFNYGTVDTTALTGFDTYPTNENGAIVYWNTSVTTDSYGLDSAHPTRLLEKALHYLRGTPEGHGTIKMVGNCWAASSTGATEIIFPVFPNNEVIIEAEEGNDFLLVPVYEVYMLRNNIIFRNINFAQTGVYKVFFAYDRNVTFENCGYYKNNGGTGLTNLPVKGDPTDESKLILATSRRKNANNDSVSNGWVLNQTITITANDDGFALNKICAAYKSGLNLVPGAGNYSYSPAPGTEHGDSSTGRTGNLNINLGENVSVKVIDAISNENNSYNVNVTLPSDLLTSGKVQLKTEDAAPAAGVDTAIYVPADKVSDTSWLKTTTTFSKQGEYGYSLRAKNSAGNYAMRAGFKVPTSELSNAVEYGVLVKRSANGNPLVWFEGNGGVNATTKVGKSVVYLPGVYDNRKIETIESTEYSSFTAPLVFSNLSPEIAQNKYDFNPYVVYQSTLKDNAGADLSARVYSYGSDTGVEIKDVSLNDMISVVKTNGNDSAKALAQEIEAAING